MQMNRLYTAGVYSVDGSILYVLHERTNHPMVTHCTCPEWTRRLGACSHATVLEHHLRLKKCTLPKEA